MKSTLVTKGVRMYWINIKCKALTYNSRRHDSVGQRRDATQIIPLPIPPVTQTLRLRRSVREKRRLIWRQSRNFWRRVRLGLLTFRRQFRGGFELHGRWRASQGFAGRVHGGKHHQRIVQRVGTEKERTQGSGASSSEDARGVDLHGPLDWENGR